MKRSTSVKLRRGGRASLPPCFFLAALLALVLATTLLERGILIPGVEAGQNICGKCCCFSSAADRDSEVTAPLLHAPDDNHHYTDFMKEFIVASWNELAINTAGDKNLFLAKNTRNPEQVDEFEKSLEQFNAQANNYETGTAEKANRENVDGNWERRTFFYAGLARDFEDSGAVLAVLRMNFAKYLGPEDTQIIGESLKKAHHNFVSETKAMGDINFNTRYKMPKNEANERIRKIVEEFITKIPKDHLGHHLKRGIDEGATGSGRKGGIMELINDGVKEALRWITGSFDIEHSVYYEQEDREQKFPGIRRMRRSHQKNHDTKHPQGVTKFAGEAYCGFACDQQFMNHIEAFIPKHKESPEKGPGKP
eukprot:Nk52_evm36s147 gene=Nk52_evmTU36s147